MRDGRQRHRARGALEEVRGRDGLPRGGGALADRGGGTRTRGARAGRVIRPGDERAGAVQGEVLRALTAAGGEMPAMMHRPPGALRVRAKANALHAVATRRRDAGRAERTGGDRRRGRAQARWIFTSTRARAFSLGEPSPEVRECAARAAGVMDRVRECLAPRPAGARAQRGDPAPLRGDGRAGRWESRRRALGRRLRDGHRLLPGLGAGNFVYDPLAEKNADRAFEPGTAAVNYEVQVFLPRHAGCFVAIKRPCCSAKGMRPGRSRPSRCHTGFPSSSRAP